MHLLRSSAATRRTLSRISIVKHSRYDGLWIFCQASSPSPYSVFLSSSASPQPVNTLSYPCNPLRVQRTVPTISSTMSKKQRSKAEKAAKNGSNKQTTTTKQLTSKWTGPFNFFGLPREVRDKIYALLLVKTVDEDEWKRNNATKSGDYDVSCAMPHRRARGIRDFPSSTED